jgi:hypothetical protein
VSSQSLPSVQPVTETSVQPVTETSVQSVTHQRNERNKETITKAMLPNKGIYGEFINVKLTKEEYEKLIIKFGDILTNDKIERLSSYIASKGKKYASHYATILNWSRKDGEGLNKVMQPQVDRMEGMKENG